MSLAQIEAEVAGLSREDLRRLEHTIHEALRREPMVESPEMLEARRRLVDEFLASGETVELEGFEETQAKDRKDNDRIFGLCRD